jgi:hypothetical protein
MPIWRYGKIIIIIIIITNSNELDARKENLQPFVTGRVEHLYSFHTFCVALQIYILLSVFRQCNNFIIIKNFNKF